MNHQTAKIIAEAYRTRAGLILNSGDKMSLRAEILYDNAAVWEQAAKAIARDEYPLNTEHEGKPISGLPGMEAPHVPQ